MAQLQKVQMVHNSAPRLITGKCRREHNYQGLAIQYNKLDTDSIYFPIGDRFQCCLQTNNSEVIATSHIVACHITKLLPSFHQKFVLQKFTWKIPPVKSHIKLKQSYLWEHVMGILLSPRCPYVTKHP